MSTSVRTSASEGISCTASYAALRTRLAICVMGLGLFESRPFGLLAADATTKAINTTFWVKMGFTLVAVLLLFYLRRRFFKDPLLDSKLIPGKGKAIAALSLICWTGAIIAGRLMAYLGPVAGLPGQTNHF